MHERDLRRQALESGKTQSRKSKAKQHLSARSSAANSTTNSPAVSPTHSQAGSRNVSNHGSDDSEDEDEDLNSSVASLDLGGGRTWGNEAPDVWQHELSAVMEQIIERSRNKRNTAEGREEMLLVYTNILRSQYAEDEVLQVSAELVPALVKCFKAGSGEKEAIYALKALAITVITTGEELYHEVQEALRLRILDESSRKAQEAAIHTLGTLAFFGGADITDAGDVMDHYLDIIETDGDSIGAQDSAAIVSAALQEWGLLATMFDSFQGRTERAMNSFENQLESSDSSVQTSAGENIALLFEQTFTPAPADAPSEVSDPDEYEFGLFKRKRWNKRYDIYTDTNDTYTLKAKLTDLSRSTARYLSKDARKELHTTFKDVLQTVEHPYWGPRYSTALNEEMTQYMGHRQVVKFPGSGGNLVVDRWWKWVRWDALKRTLAGGFARHYGGNEVVRDALPRGTLVATGTF